MMENDDAETGGEELTVEQAADAYLKSTAEGAKEAKPEVEQTEDSEQADDELQASDEDEGEESGEPDEEGQAEEEDEEEPDSDQGRFVAANGKVRLPDGTVSTVNDLIQGNLRDRDYRQKTMSLAEERRAFEEQSSAIKASEQQVNERQEYLARLMESIAPQAPDPAMLDPNSDKFDLVGYHQQKDQHERFHAHLNYLKQQSDVAKAEADKQTANAQMKKANEEWGRLQEAMPSLKDEAKLKAFSGAIMEAGQAAGFSPDEIKAQVPLDHRMALVLHKAAQWDRLQASKPKVQQKVQGKPPVQKAGKRLTPDAQRAARAADAMNRLKQSGSVNDAVAAYLAIKKG